MREPVLFFLLFFLCASALAANSITNTSYVFKKPNAKNFLYVNQNTPLSVTVDVESYTKDATLALNFFSADNSALAVYPTSPCVDSTQTEVFRLNGENVLFAKDDITITKTCTYTATIYATTANVVFSKLSVASSDTLLTVPSFTTSKSYFKGTWSARFPLAGEFNTFTVNSDIVFAKADTFVITASNGAPFLAATACVSGETALFTVSAQGARLLFVARDALTSSFSCSVTVTVAGTTIQDPSYIFAAPSHGLSAGTNGFVSLLDKPGATVRMGLHGVFVQPKEPNTADNAMYLGIPASAVRAGDTIKLHLGSWYGGDITTCKYKNGAVAGTIKKTIEAYTAFLYTSQSGLLTLASPMPVSTNNYVELLCPIQLYRTSDYKFQIMAVSVPSGVFSMSPDAESSYRLQGHSPFDDIVAATVYSYTEGVNAFTVKVANNFHGQNSYVDADLSLRGVTFAGVADVESKCTFSKTASYQTIAPFGITVTNGEARFRIDSKTVLDNDLNINIKCVFGATVGSTLSVYDNIAGREVTAEPVDEGSVSLIFGDGQQTHWLSSDAVPNGLAIPFTFNALNMYTDSNLNTRHRRFQFVSGQFQILNAPGADSLDLSCSSGTVEAMVDDQWIYDPAGSYSVSLLPFTLTAPFDAACTGSVALAYYPVLRPSFDAIQFDLYKYHEDTRIEVKNGWQNYVQLPQFYNKNQFSFFAETVVLGVSTTFTVGHTLLDAQDTFTLTFNHTLTLDHPTCTVGDIVVLDCSVAENKLSFTCTKQAVVTIEPCSLSVTFNSDFERVISVTSAFTGLPEGVVFHPTFNIHAQSPEMLATASSPVFAGQEVSITYSLPRAPLTTDVLAISHIDMDDARLDFVRFEPNTGDTSGAVTKVENGYAYILLALLDTAAVTASNFKVVFRHVPKIGYAGEFATYELSSSLNAVFVPPVVSLTFDPSPVQITAVPSAASTLYSIVAVAHPDMAVDDSFTINDITFPDNAAPELRCEGQAAAIPWVNNKFTLPATASASEPCYIVLWTNPSTKNYWSVTATISGVLTTVYAAAPAVSTATPFITASGVLVKDAEKTVTLTIPDFTSAFVTDVTNAVRFNFHTAEMSISAVTCSSVSGSITAGSVELVFTANDVPLSAYGPLVCSVILTPLSSVTAPAFTGVQILGKSLSNIILPASRAIHTPYLAMSFPLGSVVKGGDYEMSFVFEEMTPVVGATITLSTSPADMQFDLYNCASVTFANGVITIDAVEAIYTCTFTPMYLSDIDVSVTIIYTAPDATPLQFTATAPASFKQGLSLELISQETYVFTYRMKFTSYDKTPYFSMYMQNRFHSVNSVIQSNCTPEGNGQTLYFDLIIPENEVTVTCEIRAIFPPGKTYIPDVYDINNRLYIYHSATQTRAYIPAIISPTPTVTAGLANNRVTFAFSNADADTITMENAWGLIGTAASPIKVLSTGLGTPQVGKAVSSADGSTLTVTFDAGFVQKVDNKHSIVACFLDVTPLRNNAMQATSPDVRFTVGSTSTVVLFDYNRYSVKAAVSDAMLAPGKPYEVALQLNLAGNPANLVIDYRNTALASAVKCATAKNFASTDYNAPVVFTTVGSSTVIALRESNMFLQWGSAAMHIKCVFDTVSAEAVSNKVGPYSKRLTVSIKGATSIDFFSAPVPVAIPFSEPTAAVAHTLALRRSTLFFSVDLAALTKMYVTGLRKSVAALLDSQVTVTGQKLVAATPSTVGVPSPIMTEFVVAADASVEVTFTVLSTTAAPVTTSVIDAALSDIMSSLSGYTVTPMAVADAVVDGECASRCGLGCALCVQGEACSTDVDCTDGYCDASGVCGAEALIDNGVSTASVSVSLLAVLAAALIL